MDVFPSQLPWKQSEGNPSRKSPGMLQEHHMGGPQKTCASLTISLAMGVLITQRRRVPTPWISPRAGGGRCLHCFSLRSMEQVGVTRGKAGDRFTEDPQDRYSCPGFACKVPKSFSSMCFPSGACSALRSPVSLLLCM